MGRRKRKQTAKYSAQFAKTFGNKLKRFLKFHPDGSGTVPTAKTGNNSVRKKVTD